MNRPEKENSFPQKQPEAAVAIITCPEPHESVLVLRRVSDPKDPWSGHFSLPGGRKERRDNDIFATCVRETYEETAITLEKNNFVEAIPPLAAGQRLASPLLVQPFIFRLSGRPELHLESKEIADYGWLSINLFRDRNLHRTTEVMSGELFPTYPLQDYYIWGFTYRLLTDIFPPIQ